MTEKCSQRCSLALRCSSACTLVSIAIVRPLVDSGRSHRASSEHGGAATRRTVRCPSRRIRSQPRCGRRPERVTSMAVDQADASESARPRPRARTSTSRAAWRRRRSSSSTRTARASRTSTGASTSTSSAASARSTAATRPRPSCARCRSRPSATCTSASRSRCTSRTSRSAAASARCTRARSRRRRCSSTPAPRRSRTPSRSRATRPSRDAVICFDQGFHGRTMMAMTLTSKVDAVQEGLRPVRARGLPRRRALALPRHRHRRGARLACASCSRARSTPQSVGGDRSTSRCRARAASCPPRPGFVEGLIEICREHGMVYIDDEVQTGMGRTGTVLAVDQMAGVEPDLIVWGKSLGGGLPLAGVSGRAELMDAPHAGGLGGTFGGNPLSCVAGARRARPGRGPRVPRALARDRRARRRRAARPCRSATR